MACLADGKVKYCKWMKKENDKSATQYVCLYFEKEYLCMYMLISIWHVTLFSELPELFPF